MYEPNDKFCSPLEMCKSDIYKQVIYGLQIKQMEMEFACKM